MKYRLVFTYRNGFVCWTKPKKFKNIDKVWAHMARFKNHRDIESIEFQYTDWVSGFTNYQ